MPHFKGFLQLGQCDAGNAMFCSNGILYITTFKKDPIAIPKENINKSIMKVLQIFYQSYSIFL